MSQITPEPELESSQPVYHIETVEDFLQVPEDRLSDCLKDFADFIFLAHTTKDLLQSIDVETAGEITVEWSAYKFTWIDDGKKNVKIILETPTLVESAESGESGSI